MAPAVVPVVAVTGPSGVGKTTLAESLCALVPPAAADASHSPQQDGSTIIHQDDFFNVTLADPTDYGPDRPNLETPSGVDWPRFVAAIEAARDDLAATGDGVGLVVVEGFLLLAADADSGHSGALPLFDAVFFLDCPGEECLRRRLVRNPNRTAEQAAGLRSYWERCTWPGYLAFTAPVLEQLRAAPADERLAVIDATRSEDEVQSALWSAATAHPRLQALQEQRDVTGQGGVGGAAEQQGSSRPRL